MKMTEAKTLESAVAEAQRRIDRCRAAWDAYRESIPHDDHCSQCWPYILILQHIDDPGKISPSGKKPEPPAHLSTPIRLWLDDIRPPSDHGRLGWTWVKTAEEAIRLLSTGQVIEADLDHDLSIKATMGEPAPDEKTGYTVVCWMETFGMWPRDGVHVHTQNPAGRARMLQVIEKYT